MGADYENMVVNLMGLGFPREQVVRALKASFNNPDRAADYLFNGIPESALRASGQAAGGAPTGGAGATGAAATGGASGASSPGGAAQGAANIPAIPPALAGGDDDDADMGALGAGGVDFAQLSSVLQQQPQLIPVIMQQIARSNPQLHQLVNNNPQALIQLLAAMGQAQQGGGGGLLGAAGGAAGAGGGASAAGSGGAGAGAAAGAGAGAGAAGGTRRIAITQEEKQSLDNLEALGFSRQKALEAFLICDRNEELAANYLFDHAGDEMLDERPAGGGV